MGKKKIEYQKILEEFDVSSSSVFVCGDRIGLDLQPAKELGCITIFMRNGRGLQVSLPDKNVDHVIHELNELKKIIP
jgi:FMN phosphatase YigB (HAD superfamily)